MCALRGDLFQIADEDPLALGADAVPSDRTDRLQRSEPRRRAAPACAGAYSAESRTRLRSAEFALVAFAALLCAAALVVLSATGPRQRGTAAARPRRRGRPSQTRRVAAGEQTRERQRHDRRDRAARAKRRPPPDDDRQSSVDRGPAALSSADRAAANCLSPRAAEREFGFER